MVRVAQQTGRVLQTGSQQRSENRTFRLAYELVRNGRIGRVRHIECRIGDNPRGGPFQVVAVPQGLDWNFWLGPTPRVDYVPQRCHYEFRWWYDYSGGKMTDWGAHHLDIAQWVLDMDNSGPVEIAGTGDAPAQEPNSYNCHPHFSVDYRYANGVTVRCQSRGENGVRIEGEDGRWIFASRGAIRASDQRIIDEPLPNTAQRLANTGSHMANFIHCVRQRQQPICHVGIGHRSVSVCHLGNIAIRTGWRLRWDPAREQFTGERAEEATRWLSRERRPEWRLEA
jgi:predicted dehydrogenase